jgi:hypothetical protein
LAISEGLTSSSTVLCQSEEENSFESSFQEQDGGKTDSAVKAASAIRWRRFCTRENRTT